MSNIIEKTEVLLKGSSELLPPAKTEAKAKAIAGINNSDEFFLITRKGDNLEVHTVNTDPAWIMQGITDFLYDSNPPELKPAIDKLKSGLSLLALVMQFEAHKKGHNQ